MSTEPSQEAPKDEKKAAPYSCIASIYEMHVSGVDLADNTVLVSSRDRLLLWDFENKKMKYKVPGCRHLTTAIALNPFKTDCFARGCTNGCVRVEKGASSTLFKPSDEDGGKPISAVSFNSNGYKLAAIRNSTILLFALLGNEYQHNASIPLHYSPERVLFDKNDEPLTANTDWMTSLKPCCLSTWEAASVETGCFEAIPADASEKRMAFLPNYRCAISYGSDIDLCNAWKDKCDGMLKSQKLKLIRDCSNTPKITALAFYGNKKIIFGDKEGAIQELSWCEDAGNGSGNVDLSSACNYEYDPESKHDTKQKQLRIMNEFESKRIIGVSDQSYRTIQDEKPSIDLCYRAITNIVVDSKNNRFVTASAGGEIKVWQAND